MRHWDIFADLPDDMIGQYDHVHVRLLVLVLDGNCQPVIGNLLKMLKPRGEEPHDLRASIKLLI